MPAALISTDGMKLPDDGPTFSVNLPSNPDKSNCLSARRPENPISFFRFSFPPRLMAPSKSMIRLAQSPPLWGDLATVKLNPSLCISNRSNSNFDFSTTKLSIFILVITDGFFDRNDSNRELVTSKFLSRNDVNLFSCLG